MHFTGGLVFIVQQGEGFLYRLDRHSQRKGGQAVAAASDIQAHRFQFMGAQQLLHMLGGVYIVRALCRVAVADNDQPGNIGVVVHGFQLLLMHGQKLQRHVDAGRQHGICANRQNGVCVQIILDEKVYS